MKRMLSAINKILKRERGFTLVEMVTVVAIMGVMAAVAVPMVNNQLGKTREKSYLQDTAMIQTAVDSFFTAADNVRHLGQRQFPLMGSSISKGNPDTDITSGDRSVLLFSDTTTSFPLDPPLNQVKATLGGEPKWRDGNNTSDGNRKLDTDGTPLVILKDDIVVADSEEGLNNPLRTLANDKTGGWYVDDINFQTAVQAIDSRDYFVDFRLLVDAGLLQATPESASPDNGGGTTEGSYSWYVKETGQVESLLYFLPSNSQKFGVADDPLTLDIDESIVEDDPTTTDVDESDDGSVDTRGFQDGVYP